MPKISRGQIIGECFRECLGGYVACGLLRENIHRLSGHSRIGKIPFKTFKDC